MNAKKRDFNSRPWRSDRKPERILAIRLHALGDTVITLPYLQSLKNNYPETELDFLTSIEYRTIPDNLAMFQDVFALKGGWNFRAHMLHGLLILPKLNRRRYDVIIDLQRRTLTQWFRRVLRPVCWSEFDRYSPIPAGERTRRTIEETGLGPVQIAPTILKHEKLGIDKLITAGWSPDNDLVVLSPAGAYETRNWPIENYVEFARRWMSEYPATQFAVFGPERMISKSNFLKENLGDRLINLVNITTIEEGYSIVRKARFVLAEDGSLLHMAWTNCRPTLALLGSFRSDWGQPLGVNSDFLDSSDLPCGNCMKSACPDVQCLVRYSPDEVFQRARDLINRTSI